MRFRPQCNFSILGPRQSDSFEQDQKLDTVKWRSSKFLLHNFLQFSFELQQAQSIFQDLLQIRRYSMICCTSIKVCPRMDKSYLNRHKLIRGIWEIVSSYSTNNPMIPQNRLDSRYWYRWLSLPSGPCRVLHMLVNAMSKKFERVWFESGVELVPDNLCWPGSKTLGGSQPDDDDCFYYYKK